MARVTLRPFIVGIAGIALLCAIFLPAGHIQMTVFIANASINVSLMQGVNGLINLGEVWAVIVAAIGMVIVAIAIFGYEDDEPGTMKWPLAIGTLLTLFFPWRLTTTFGTALDEIMEDESVLGSFSLGPGVIILSMGFIMVTGIVWYASTLNERQQVTWSPSKTTPSGERPSWMARDIE